MQNKANFDDFNIDEVEAKKFIRLGIKEELQFEVINNQNSQYQLLDQRQLNEIYSNHPEKRDVRLTDAHYNQQSHKFDKLSYAQSINYENLWFDRSQFEKILKKHPQYSQKKLALLREDSIVLENSQYWRKFKDIVCKAIISFPTCHKKQRNAKVDNVVGWLKETYEVTDREAHIITNILSDFYEDINKRQ
jgi:hypothetical protein